MASLMMVPYMPDAATLGGSGTIQSGAGAFGSGGASALSAGGMSGFPGSAVNTQMGPGSVAGPDCYVDQGMWSQAAAEDQRNNIVNIKRASNCLLSALMFYLFKDSI